MGITEYDEAKTFLEQRNEGYAEGRVEGRAEGSRSQAIETARTMLSDGESLDKIQRYSGLSLPEIQNLT